MSDHASCITTAGIMTSHEEPTHARPHERGGNSGRAGSAPSKRTREEEGASASPGGGPQPPAAKRAKDGAGLQRTAFPSDAHRISAVIQVSRTMSQPSYCCNTTKTSQPSCSCFRPRLAQVLHKQFSGHMCLRCYTDATA